MAVAEILLFCACSATVFPAVTAEKALCAHVTGYIESSRPASVGVEVARKPCTFVRRAESAGSKSDAASEPAGSWQSVRVTPASLKRGGRKI